MELNNILDVAKFIEDAASSDEAILDGNKFDTLKDYFNPLIKQGIEVLDANFPQDSDQAGVMKAIALATTMLMATNDPSTMLVMSMMHETMVGIIVNAAKIAIGLVKAEHWIGDDNDILP